MAKTFKVIATLIALNFMLVACGSDGGGGGSDGGNNNPPTTDTTLDWDEDNWDEKDWT